MRKFRLVCAGVIGMMVSASGLLFGIPDAFALPVHNQLGTSAQVASAPIVSSGMGGWEVALVAVAAALFAAGVTVVSLRIRFGPTPRPATS